MSIEDVGFDSAKFSEVWSRVMPDGGEAKKQMVDNGEVAKLREFMEAECEAVLHVTAIAARCCRCVGAELLEVAECDRQHFKELRTRYFILTGERYCQPELCPVPGAVIEALRHIYIAKLQLTEDYQELGKKVELYEALAEEEACTADKIFMVLTKLLCK